MPQDDGPGLLVKATIRPSWEAESWVEPGDKNRHRTQKVVAIITPEVAADSVRRLHEMEETPSSSDSVRCQRQTQTAGQMVPSGRRLTAIRRAIRR